MSSEGAGAGALGGALRLLIKLVTLFTVVSAGAGSGVLDGAGSSVARLAVRVDAFALPKLKPHRDGFFVGAEGVVDEGGDAGRRGLGGFRDGAERREEGIAYIETGSRAALLRVEDVEVASDGVLDCLLSSRTRDCEATARLTMVSSWGEIGPDVAPLPLRAPRLRLRLEVDAARD